MSQTFFFYDLETSGLNPRQDRIMQFAGQRTTPDFEPIGEPYNILVKLNDDTLPSPDALLVTGITPQQTQADGITEAEFAKLLLEEVFTEDGWFRTGDQDWRYRAHPGRREALARRVALFRHDAHRHSGSVGREDR